MLQAGTLPVYLLPEGGSLTHHLRRATESAAWSLTCCVRVCCPAHDLSEAAVVGTQRVMLTSCV